MTGTLSRVKRTVTKEAAIIGLLVGLATTSSVYATGTSIGFYEGFWGLSANLLSIIILNPSFAVKEKQQTNRVKEFLFDSSKNFGIKKGSIRSCYTASSGS